MGVPIAIQCIKEPEAVLDDPNRLSQFQFKTSPMGSRRQVWEALAAIGKPSRQDAETGVMPDRGSGVVEFDDGTAWQVDLDVPSQTTDQVDGVSIEMRGVEQIGEDRLRQRFAALCAPFGWTAYLKNHDASSAILFSPADG
jgi:hypothetical protein